MNNYYGYTPSEQVPAQGYMPPDYVSPLERKKLRRSYNAVGMVLLASYIGMIIASIFIKYFLAPSKTFNADGIRVLSLKETLLSLTPPALIYMAVFAVYCLISKYDPKELFRTSGVRVSEVLKYILIVLGLQHITVFINYFLITVIYSAGYYVPSTTFVLDHTPGTYAANMFAAVILAPIGEELIFRGVVLRCSAKISQRFAIFFSALIFGLMHGNPYQFILGFAIGIPLAMITIKSGSLIPSILCHMANNFAACIPEIIGYSNEEAGDAAWLCVIVFSVIAGTAVIIYEAVMKNFTLPAYTKYHKKRTLPIVITSWSTVTIILMYITEIVMSIKPVPPEMLGSAEDAAEAAVKLLLL